MTINKETEELIAGHTRTDFPETKVSPYIISLLKRLSKHNQQQIIDYIEAILEKWYGEVERGYGDDL